jgi:hypothetical protein
VSLRDHLQEIYDDRGRLTPEIVVEVARPKTHPLHAMVFDKPQKEAAEAWYRHRAHELITSVKITYRTVDDQPRKARAFHAVRDSSGYRYEPADVVAADPELTELMRREMEREWKALFDRYRQFDDFVEMVKATVGEEALTA